MEFGPFGDSGGAINHLHKGVVDDEDHGMGAVGVMVEVVACENDIFVLVHANRCQFVLFVDENLVGVDKIIK